MSIASEITRLQTAKADIKTAIEAKGVTVPANAKLDDYDTYVASIPTGGTSILPQVIDRTVTTVTAGDLAGVTKIGDGAFRSCSYLISVTLPSTLQAIGSDAFLFCNRLANINIPSSVVSIDGGAFSYCYALPNSIGTSLTNVTQMGSSVFNKCEAFTDFVLNAGISETSYGFMTECVNMTSVTFNTPNLTKLGTRTFYGCSALTSVTINTTAGLQRIDGGAFHQCSSLVSFTIPNTVTYLGDTSFADCTSLTTINIPVNSTLVKIERNMFARCTSLAIITIPDNISNIDSGVFDGCTSLATINYTGTVAQWGSMTLGSNWHRNCPATVVHCSDGDVTL